MPITEDPLKPGVLSNLYIDEKLWTCQGYRNPHNCHFALFGARTNATMEEIFYKARRLSLWFHPDRCDRLIERFCKEKLSSNMDDEEFHHAVELCKAEVAKWYTDVLQEKLTNLKDLCPANWITLKEHLDKDDAGYMIDTKGAHYHFLHHWLVSLGFQKIVTDFASFDLNQQDASVVGVKQRLEHHEAKEV